MKRHYAMAFALTTVLAVAAYVTVISAKPVTFRAHLSGQNVFPAVNTLAQGDAMFQLNRAGDELSFTLVVSNLENATQAHVHVGSHADSLGQLIVTLYDGLARTGRLDGVLAEGILRPTDLKGPLMDQPMSALIAMFMDGLAYVDVHTEQIPTGEIRGQVQ